jgi:hypothetical protein
MGDDMVNRYNPHNPLRLTADLSLLKTDTQQLGLHLRWLLADLQDQQGLLNSQAEAFAGLAIELNTYLPRLDELDALLLRFGQVTLDTSHGYADLAEPTPQAS